LYSSLPKKNYIHRFVLYILPFLIIIHRCVSAGISIAVSPYEPVTSYISGRFFVLHNKYEMLKSLPSYNEYHIRLNLATVQVWQTIRSRCRDGFITLSIKSVHFFISKLMQYRYSISLVTPVYHSWTSRIIFWVTLTRSVSSMTNDTAL
ncbi:BnaCnng62220D, partial [Brassica napus]